MNNTRRPGWWTRSLPNGGASCTHIAPPSYYSAHFNPCSFTIYAITQPTKVQNKTKKVIKYTSRRRKHCLWMSWFYGDSTRHGTDHEKSMQAACPSAEEERFVRRVLNPMFCTHPNIPHLSMRRHPVPFHREHWWCLVGAIASTVAVCQNAAAYRTVTRYRAIPGTVHEPLRLVHGDPSSRHLIAESRKILQRELHRSANLT